MKMLLYTRGNLTRNILDDNLYVYTISSLKFLSRKDEIENIIYENQKLQ